MNFFNMVWLSNMNFFNMVWVNNNNIILINNRRQVHYNVKFRLLCKTAFKKITYSTYSMCTIIKITC